MSRSFESSAAVATALAPFVGYERAAELAKEVLRSGRTIREMLESPPGLSPDLIEQAGDLISLAALESEVAKTVQTSFA